MGSIRLDIPTLRKNGDKLNSDAVDFKQSGQSLYSTIDDLVTNHYKSADAMALANRMKDFQNDIVVNIPNAITAYGNHLLGLAGGGVKVQEEGINLVNRIGG